MSELYNFEYYHNCCGPIAYEEPAHWVEFFGGIADRIVKDLHPATVLDAGCAMGYLVAALRDRGVEAYGIDISEYAISMVRGDIKPFCVVGSLMEPLPQSLPQRYDLVVTIEVLEHLYAEDGRKAIQNLCKLSDKIIFSSTPDDFTERTHVNVQQREYWARIFAAEGFIDDLNYRPAYLTPYASYFQRSGDWLRQVEDYERNIRMTETQHRLDIQYWTKAVEDKERHIQNQNLMLQNAEQQRTEQEARYAEELQAAERQRAEQEARHAEELQAAEQQRAELEIQYTEELQTLEQQLQEQGELLEERDRHTADIEGELAHYKEHYLAAIGQREELRRQATDLQAAYDAISNATFWKMTKPFRATVNFIRRVLKSNRYTNLFCKGLKCWKEHGLRYTWKEVQNWRHHRHDFLKVRMPLYTEEELEAQRDCVFSREIKFSILVPLYNTPESFLHEMIQSVLDQTYTNWELCMADGSDEKHRNVEKICRQYTRKDKRVKYKKLKQNLGISENTNACIDMSDGDYIALFDHDDLLHPSALYEVMKAICDQDADFIYTDEATFESPNVDRIITAHFKPDFAIDNLRANNYICHLSVFRKDVLSAAGRFRAEYDGSQDHDMVLRLTANAKKIVHIPHVLYYWRSHPQSVSMDISSKEYAIKAGKNAVRDSILSCGYKVEIESSKAFPTIYRLKYELSENAKVSIIIPNKNHLEDLKKCIHSIMSRTTYSNYEIVIVDNGSTDEKLFDYYRSLKENAAINVYSLDIPFNYSKLNNFAVSKATGEYFVFLNNDTEVNTPEWLEEMLMYVQREDVAAAGAMLYYPDQTIQHAGVILGLGQDRIAGHPFHRYQRGHIGYMGRLCYAQDMSAVTAACMMVKASVYRELGGFDEDFQVAYNDVDLCMRIRQAGYLIVWTPYAELYHYESKSRGYEDSPEKRKRFEEEAQRFRNRWAKELAAGDPYYNPNLTLDRGDFSLK